MKFKLADSDSELNQILELQAKNHLSNVSENRKITDGFLTVRHDFELLKTMNLASKQVIALHGNTVIGYALVMTKEQHNLIPTLTPMFEVLKKIKYKNNSLSDLNYYVMGQICVAEAYRGKGVFQALYRHHKQYYSSQFDLCITEISTNNKRSMNAHQKIGFKIVDTFKDEFDEWNIVCWDWEN